MSEEHWVTVADVDLHLGAEKGLIDRWRERKGLPAHKIRRLLKIQLSEGVAA